MYIMANKCKRCGKVIGKYTKTGLCVDCWHQFNRGEEASNWRGGITPYKIIAVNGKQILEHRYVWEREYGEIPKGWVIHHLNGDKRDNRIDNLMAMPSGYHWSDHQLAVKLKNKQIKNIHRYLFSNGIRR